VAIPLSIKYLLPERLLLTANIGLPSFIAKLTACIVPLSFSQAITTTLLASAICIRALATNLDGFALEPYGCSVTISPLLSKMLRTNPEFSFG
jgi:hypothetical protein